MKRRTKYWYAINEFLVTRPACPTFVPNSYMGLVAVNYSWLIRIYFNEFAAWLEPLHLRSEMCSFFNFFRIGKTLCVKRRLKLLHSRGVLLMLQDNCVAKVISVSGENRSVEFAPIFGFDDIKEIIQNTCLVLKL